MPTSFLARLSTLGSIRRASASQRGPRSHSVYEYRSLQSNFRSTTQAFIVLVPSGRKDPDGVSIKRSGFNQPATEMCSADGCQIRLSRRVDPQSVVAAAKLECGSATHLCERGSIVLVLGAS